MRRTLITYVLIKIYHDSCTWTLAGHHILKAAVDLADFYCADLDFDTLAEATFLVKNSPQPVRTLLTHILSFAIGLDNV